jgi:hypothetical protein
LDAFSFTASAYKFNILYKTEDSTIYLESKTPQQVTQPKSSKLAYFRHYISSVNSDISVVMTIYSGKPVMFINIDPKKST